MASLARACAAMRRMTAVEQDSAPPPPRPAMAPMALSAPIQLHGRCRGAYAPRRQTAAPARSAGSPPGPGTAAWRRPAGRGAAPARPSPRAPAGRTPSRTATAPGRRTARPARRARSAMATPASTSAVRATCAPPRPKIAARIAHSRLGRSSRPIRNSSMHHAELGEVQDRAHLVDGYRGPARTARSARRPAGSPARCRCAAAWRAAPPPPRRPERGRFA